MKITVYVFDILKIIGASVLAGAVIQELGRAKWPSVGMVVGFALAVIGMIAGPVRERREW